MQTELVGLLMIDSTQHDDGATHFDTNEEFGDPSSQASLEDLCRSHLVRYSDI